MDPAVDLADVRNRLRDPGSDGSGSSRTTAQNRPPGCEVRPRSPPAPGGARPAAEDVEELHRRDDQRGRLRQVEDADVGRGGSRPRVPRSAARSRERGEQRRRRCRRRSTGCPAAARGSATRPVPAPRSTTAPGSPRPRAARRAAGRRRSRRSRRRARRPDRRRAAAPWPSIRPRVRAHRQNSVARPRFDEQGPQLDQGRVGRQREEAVAETRPARRSRESPMPGHDLDPLGRPARVLQAQRDLGGARAGAVDAPAPIRRAARSRRPRSRRRRGRRRSGR